MYKNYIFDLYGTLIDIRTNENKPYLWQKVSEFYRFHGADYSPQELKKEYEKLCMEEGKKIQDVEWAEIQIEKVFLKLFEQKGVQADISLATHIGEMFRILSTKYLRVYDGVIDFLEELKEKGKKIYLLSNAQYIFTIPEMKALKIYDYFDGIVISSTEECKKPDPKFFDIVINRYNLKKEESIMIGNDSITDIKGAHDSGLKSLYIHANISPEIKGELLSDYSIMDGDFRKISKLILK